MVLVNISLFSIDVILLISCLISSEIVSQPINCAGVVQIKLNQHWLVSYQELENFLDHLTDNSDYMIIPIDNYNSTYTWYMIMNIFISTDFLY